jgi:hypothetical protein
MKVKDWHEPKDQMCNLGRHSWSVPRLFELARELPVMDVPLNHLSLYYTYEKAHAARNGYAHEGGK